MRFLLTFIILFSTWFLLSGETNPILIFLGILSSVFITYLSGNLLISERNLKKIIHIYLNFLKYLLYLMWEIIKANLDLAFRVLNPKLTIDPVIIKFTSNLETDFCIVIYANSITLTPGTVTIDVNKKREFIVHSLTPEHSESIISGKLEKRIKEIENV